MAMEANPRLEFRIKVRRFCDLDMFLLVLLVLKLSNVRIYSHPECKYGS